MGSQIRTRSEGEKAEGKREARGGWLQSRIRKRKEPVRRKSNRKNQRDEVLGLQGRPGSGAAAWDPGLLARIRGRCPESEASDQDLGLLARIWAC